MKLQKNNYNKLDIDLLLKIQYKYFKLDQSL